MYNTDAAAVKKWKDASGTEHAANFIIGAKYCLETMGYINPTNTAAGSWKGCNRRAWCNTVFYESMLDAFGVDTSDNFFKCVSNVTGSATSDTTAGALITTYDYFALPTMKEFTGNDLSAYVPASEYGSSQNVKFEWYTADNIPQIMSETYYMWTRSPYEYKGNGSPTMWNLYYTGGTNIKYGDGYPETPYGLAPFGCL
jgi:hypothetical protein